MYIYPLKAAHGDALIIKFFAKVRQYTIVVDGGPVSTADDIADIYDTLEYIDLLILTHYDEDHISGLLEYFSRHKNDHTNRIGKVWVNGAHLIYYDDEENTTSYDNAFSLITCLDKLKTHGFIGQWDDNVTDMFVPVITEDYRIDILSPTNKILETLEKKFEEYIEEHGLQDEPDMDTEVSLAHVLADSKKSFDELSTSVIKSKTSFMNSTSIAFLLRAEGKCILLLGDADPIVVTKSLEKLILSDSTLGKPLHIDLMKVSHHGSKANIRKKLLELIDCQKYLFTTNGGTGGGFHPDRMTLAYIWKYSSCPMAKKLTLYFNYPLSKIEAHTVGVLSSEEKAMFNIVDEYEDNSKPKITI